MFCDLVGSTALSARLDPEDMREIVGTYHRCCAEQITKAGGFVAKYMGDGVLAYFGYPQAHEDDAERALRAGLGLVDAVANLPTDHGTSLQVRVGVATGLVIVGDLIGEGDAQERGVVGETPNLAARLQGVAEPGEVVISQTTRRLTGGMFEYRDLGPISLKGLSEPVRAWQVTGASAAQGRFEAQHETSLTPLVGRDEEIELLLKRWRQAASREGRVVLLSGEPGIGKSRLTAELQERLQSEPHTRLRYFCSPQHTDSAFYPVISQLERAAQFERQDGSGTKFVKLSALVGGPSSGHLQLLSELLSIPSDGDLYQPLSVSPQRKKQQTIEALLRQLEMLSNKKPVLMVFEDVHWIDPSSREVLELTVERAKGLPLLLVITFRPEFQAPWVGQPHVTAMSLSRLGHRQGAALVGSVAGSTRLAPEVMAEIAERADGVPLFVEELTKAVVEAEVKGGSGAVALTAAPSSGFSVPASLHTSLMARLDHLGVIAKETAQIGAVIGREFSYQLLASVAEKSDAELQTALSKLAEAGLVFCRGRVPEATYLFKHALVRDAAYSTLLRRQRQELHARVASALEGQFEEITNSQPGLLAQHCAEAGLVEQAITYWLKAGRQAVARSEMSEATSQLRKAIALVSTQPADANRQRAEFDLQMALGRALIATKGYVASETAGAFARARTLCTELNEPPELAARLLYYEFTSNYFQGRLNQALERANEMERLAEAQNDSAMRFLGARFLGTCYHWMGRFIEARAPLERALAHYNPKNRPIYAAFGVDDPQIIARMHLSSVLSYMGYLDQARHERDSALAEARQLGHPYPLGNALTMDWAPGVDSGDQILQAAEELLALAAAHGYARLTATGSMMKGRALAALGQGSEGAALVRRGIADLEARGDVLLNTRHLTELAEMYIRLGQEKEAGRLLEEAMRAVEVKDERAWEAEVYRVCANLHVLTDDRAAAEASLLKALTIGRQQSAKLWELRAGTTLARLWKEQGRRSEAVDLLAPIYGWFTEGFDTPNLKDARTLLEELAK
jgi:predicted ATPase/class 3 adenylate cyclase